MHTPTQYFTTNLGHLFSLMLQSSTQYLTVIYSIIWRHNGEALIIHLQTFHKLQKERQSEKYV